MNAKFFEEFGKAVQELDQDSDVRVVIVWAEGKIFTAGLDLKEAGTSILNTDTEKSEAEKNVTLYNLIRSWQLAFDSARISKKPYIGCIHADCIGGGVDLITAFDIRLCTSDTTFCVAELKLAIVADIGTLQRISKIVGTGFAREMAFTAEKITSERALAAGLVNKIFENKEKLLEEAREMAKKIAQFSPLAVQGTKLCLNYAEEHSISEGLAQVVALWNSAFIHSSDLIEAFQSYFQKRTPQFKCKL